MKHKIILITGASDGVGKQTAITLAKQGHTLIIHGRNKAKTKASYDEIIASSGNHNVDMYTADFLSLASVKQFSEEIKSKYEHIDVLINNAGAQFTDTRELTHEGHEKTMVINVFAPMLLTLLLMDLLKKSESARVVTVASDAHKMTGKPNLDDLELSQGYTMPKAYGLSKLYIIWVMRHFTSEMRRLGINNITFNSVHPGSTASNLGREAAKSLKWKILFFLWTPLLVSIDKAASSSILAATSESLEGINNKYIGPKGEELVKEKYYSADNELKVWNYSMNVIKDYL